jgi:hypothetical protein
MKKRIKISGTFLFTLITFALVSENVHGKMDWAILRQVDLNTQPIDVAISEDGKLVFVLTAGEIVVYSPSENKIENRIPIDREFDRMTYSGKNNTIALTSSSSKILRIVRVDWIYDIDISGLPFKGVANAPVIIAVFDDYQ